MEHKFERINSQLVNIKYYLTKNMEDIFNDSFSKIKDEITEGLRAVNLKLQQNVEALEIKEKSL